MENASKALLIAGGVLVALLVISLGMYIIGRAQNTAVSAEERRLQTLTQEQINKFSQYSGEIYGMEVENCIRRIASYNKDKASSERILITLSKNTGGTGIVEYDGSADEIIDPAIANKMKNIMSETDRNDIYTGTITYLANGMIEKIDFVLKEKK
ncbi:MAG: hypothetical protein E7311_01790 [Clostridiales bacterium]|nr:hypothetical protein [Clostridiales bacterium]